MRSVGPRMGAVHTPPVHVRALEGADRPWLRRLIDETWGLPAVSISGPHDPGDLPGFIAEIEAEPVGALTYRIADATCEVVTLNALRPGQGVGTALLAAAKWVADEAGVRLWLITTDSNVTAIEFYRGRGMHVTAVYEDFVDVVRRHKPVGNPDNPVPFRHALEFSFSWGE